MRTRGLVYLTDPPFVSASITSHALPLPCTNVAATERWIEKCAEIRVLHFLCGKHKERRIHVSLKATTAPQLRTTPTHIKIYDLDGDWATLRRSDVAALGAIVETTYRQYIRIFKYLRTLNNLLSISLSFLFFFVFAAAASMCVGDPSRRRSTGRIRTHLGHVRTLWPDSSQRNCLWRIYSWMTRA